MATTRSAAEVWLVGKPSQTLSTARLPSRGDVLRRLLFHHIEEKQEVKKSIRATIEAVLVIWERGRIPTQRIDNAERKLKKLYDEYLLLKKHRGSQLDSCQMKEGIFQADLEELFDISTKNAAEVMKNDEDKVFLRLQQEDPLSCSMSGIDRNLTAMEARKRVRETTMDLRRQSSKAEMMEKNEVISSSSAVEIVSASSSSSSDDDEYQIPSASNTPSTSGSTKKKMKVLTSNVVSSLDRVNISDRRALFVVGTVAQALGHSVTDLSLSYSTIRRERRSVREAFATADKVDFSPDDPLLLHWDGKLLPDITGGQEKVDRIAILVTGGGVEKLLGVPKIDRGTGEQQADACMKALKDWKLKELVRGLVFDTTSSNTGLNIGACTIMERNLDRNLIWIACRHHVFEVMLSTIFTTAFGTSGGPEVGIFKRFQKQWPAINKEVFTIGSEEFYNCDFFLKLREEMVVYYGEAIKCQQPRDDYLELLHLCLIFLGGSTTSSEMNVKFRAPGATHNARWMAKAIYCIKIYLFQDQFVITAKEKKGVTDISLFVAFIYGQFWNEAPLAERAPFNDAKLLQRIQEYPNRTIANNAAKSFHRHLWYFSEHLIGLAFFDSRVDNNTKRDMANNLKQQPKQKSLKRLDAATFDCHSPLSSFVTQRTAELFDLILKNGKEKAESFLKKESSEWEMDSTYLEMKHKVRQMKVVNDCAERGIALITSFNSSVTKDEKQKQFLLRLVDLHRKEFPIASKSTLMKMTVE